jgi:hypothetical protein
VHLDAPAAQIANPENFSKHTQKDKPMFELPDGRLKMTTDEQATYREFSGITAIPLTKPEFTKMLLEAASSMRARLASGQLRPKDNLIRAEMIEDYLASPHAADVGKRHRDWIAAGCPIGEEAMRQAGLSSPALDRLERERISHAVPFSSVGAQSQRNPIDPEKSDAYRPRRNSVSPMSGKPPWITIQSALVQAELFDNLPSGRK